MSQNVYQILPLVNTQFTSTGKTLNYYLGYDGSLRLNLTRLEKAHVM